MGNIDDMKRLKLNPDIRADDDPCPGTLARTTTEIFYQIEVRKSDVEAIGRTVYTLEDIPKDSIIVMGGAQVSSSTADVPPDTDFCTTYNEKHYLAPLDFDDPTPNWFMNHSCESNIKIIGLFTLIARRDIESGEELTIDYGAVTASSRKWSMQCLQGCKDCRSIISNEDWKKREFFFNHYEEWPAFIQKKGSALFNNG